MYKRQRTQLSFYDTIYDRAVPRDHFLRKLNDVIDWNRFEKYFQDLYPSSVGNPAYNPLMKFKAIVLQFLYDLSDRQLEEQLNDRISFRYFIGVDPTERVPDHSVYCRFRDLLGSERIAELFNEVVTQARSKGIVKDRLCIVDATHVQAKVNTYQMNNMTTDKSNDDSPSHVDPDASYGYKSKNNPFFGYKVGIGLDKDSNIVTQVTATTGSKHDSTHFVDVADPHAIAVVADKGYDTPENFEHLRTQNQYPAIIVKHRKWKKHGHIIARYKNAKEYHRYYRLKKFRSYIEKMFAISKQWYGLRRARYWGLHKMKIQAILTMMAINLKRIVTLETCLQT